MATKVTTDEQERSFLYKAMCEEKDGKLYESSKRLAGMIGWIVCQVCILAATILELYFTHTISGVVSGLIMSDMASCVVLIGAKTFVSAFQGNTTKVSDSASKIEDE